MARGILKQQPLVIGIRHRDEDAGPAAGQRFRSAATVPERLPGNFEQQALLRVDTAGFSRRDSEQQRIEQVLAGKETTPARSSSCPETDGSGS